jgi:hypothetical protein
MDTLHAVRPDRAPAIDRSLIWPPLEEVEAAPVVLDQDRNTLVSLDEAERGLETGEWRAMAAHEEAPASLGACEPADAAPGEPASRTVVRALVGIIIVAQAIAIGIFVARDRWNDRPPPIAATAAAAVHAPVLFAARPAEVPAVPAPIAADAAVAGAATVVVGSGRRDGRLVVKSDPAGATVIIDGRRRGTAPLTLSGLAAGYHRVAIQQNGASVEQTVMIDAASTTSVLVPLNTSGWLDVRALLDLQISENGVAIGTSADGPLNLTPGSHRLELRNDSVGYRDNADVMVEAGAVARVRPVLPNGVLHVNALPWAHVTIDGQPAGDTPLGNLRVALGPHEIRFNHPALGEQVRQVVVSAQKPARISVDLRQ